MDTPDIIRTSLGQAMQALQDFLSSPATYESIRLAAEAMAFCLGNGGKVLACGNGGSMCDATHFAEELTGRYRRTRRPLAAVSINDPAYISCTGNDFGFDEVFSRYVLGVGAEGDVHQRQVAQHTECRAGCSREGDGRRRAHVRRKP